MIPNMKKVFSSNVQEIGYDEEHQKLIVKFTSGATYEYLGVPLETARSVMNAPSVGTALSQDVKKRFSYVRVG